MPGLPSPRSPVLSEISMILPDSDTLRSFSPTPQERPPSPPGFFAHAHRAAPSITLASAPPGRRETSLKISSPPLSAHSSRSTLRNMADSVASPKPPRSPNLYQDTLASSPTVDDSLLRPSSNDLQAAQLRRSSYGSSSSINSDDLEDMRRRWPGFDSHAGFDDSGVDLEDDDDDDEGKDRFPVDVTEPEDEPWLSKTNDHDDSTYSSDLYSKRAEMILANAKKRLNV